MRLDAAAGGLTILTIAIFLASAKILFASGAAGGAGGARCRASQATPRPRDSGAGSRAGDHIGLFSG